MSFVLASRTSARKLRIHGVTPSPGPCVSTDGNSAALEVSRLHDSPLRRAAHGCGPAPDSHRLPLSGSYCSAIQACPTVTRVPQRGAPSRRPPPGKTRRRGRIGSVKIVSLLPSATEIVFALGLGDSAQGVSFECDYPAAARGCPSCRGPSCPPRNPGRRTGRCRGQRAGCRRGIDLHPRRRPDQIDRARCDPGPGPLPGLRRALGRGRRGARRDRVSGRSCLARPRGARRGDRLRGPGRASHGHGDAGGDVDGRTAQPGGSCPCPGAGRAVPASSSSSGPIPRSMQAIGFLRWWRPPGVEPVLAEARARSVRLSWDEIAAENIDVTIFSPCGFDLAGAVEQADAFLHRPEASGLGRIVAVDANAFFSRPGPRVVDGVELLAELLHPESPGDSPSGAHELQPG